MTESLVLNPTEIADHYERWLTGQGGGAAKAFRSRLAGQRENAIVEAVTWWLLGGWYGHSVTLGELGGGGPDFDCTPSEEESTRFTVEATAFTSEAIERKTGISVAAGTYAGALGSVSDALYDRVSGKNRQSGKRTHSVIVVVGTCHWCHDIVFDRVVAEELISGRRRITFPVGDEIRESSYSTSLEGSAFIRLQDELGPEAANEAIAAVVLLGIDEHSTQAIGVLNPWARYPFNPDFLHGIPFCRGQILETGDGVKLEWVVGSPRPSRIDFVRVLPKDLS